MERVLPRLKVHLALPLFALVLGGPAVSLGAQPAQLLVDLFHDGGYPGLPPGPVNEPTFKFTTVQGKTFLWARQGPLGISDGTPLGTQLLPVETGYCNFGPKRLGLGAAGKVFYWVECIEDNLRSVLWRSDGTVDGTFQLTSLSSLNVLLPDDSSNDPPVDPTYAFAGGILYFTGCDPVNGCTLWQTDGTRQATRIVKAGERTSGAVAGVGNRVFFVSTDGSGPVLAVTDGTAAGTIHLKRFEDFDGPPLLTAAGSKLFFLARANGEHELWVSDGTGAGTRAISHFAPSDPFAATDWLKVIGDRVYFLADDGTHGTEVWRSDGTTEGTARLTDFSEPSPFQDGMSREHLAEAVAGRVVFLAADDLGSHQLWASTGTPESTTLLTEERGFDSTNGLARTSAGRVLFTRAHEVWSTDGSVAGTFKLSDLGIGKPVPLLGSVFFGTYASGVSRIWRTDGTAAGTRVFATLPPNTLLSAFREMGTAGGRVLFQARDRFYGVEIWSSNGRSGGTRILGNLTPEAVPGSGPRGLTELNGGLFFQAGTPTSRLNRTIWRSGGSAETTVPLPWTPPPGCTSGDLGDPFRIGAKIYFRSPGVDCKSTLWVTDGTSEGTGPLGIDTNPFYFGQPVDFEGQLFVLIRDVSGSVALWKNDGTPEGTSKVLDLPAEARDPSGLTALGPALYFAATDPDGVGQVWRSDGTLSGTLQLTSVESPFESSNWSQFVRAGNWVYFIHSSNQSGRMALWRTDGTPGGTVQVTQDSFDDGPMEELTAFQGKVFFFQFINGEGDGLFRSDGTPGGTVRLRTFTEGRLGDLPHFPVVFAGHLFFVADDGVHGPELWKTDGTAAGTSLVRDIFPGEPTSFPTDFVVAGGRLFFRADDGAHGSELWQSDGTTAGTRLVQDLNPGINASYPLDLTLAGGRLYFVANDGLTGFEPWYLQLGPVAPCQPSDTQLCLSGGRFRVEAQWKNSQGSTGTAHAVTLTPDTGYFWFFSPTNVEVALKVLDGRGVNGHFWIFYGALSSVEYSLTVTDTETGLARRYLNPQGQLASGADTQAFGPLGAHETNSRARASAPLLVSERVDLTAATGTCLPASRRLCLNGGRFAVEASWKDASNRTGDATAVPLTDDTGYFWFFDQANVEYTLTVTDTTTGNVKTYKNPLGRLASAADTTAF